MTHKVKNIAITLSLLLLLVITLKVADYGITYFIKPKVQTEDSTKLYGIPMERYDSIFTKIEKVIVEKNSGVTQVVIDSLTKRVKVARPYPSDTWKSDGVVAPGFTNSQFEKYVKTADTTYRKDPNKVRFYLVTTSGYISDKNGVVEYYLPSYGNQYYYELVLSLGNYTFQDMAKRDTIPFVVHKTGVYKLGFQENHPNFIVFKDSLP